MSITGADIFRFLEDLFAERLKRHGVTLTATPAFRKYTLVGYPPPSIRCSSISYNAIFWVTRRPSERVVRLDATGRTLTVADNGPEVDTRDRETIFEFGFTRKPGGRGLKRSIGKG